MRADEDHAGPEADQDGPPPFAGTDPRVLRSRAALLDAAAEVFVEHGYLGASLDDVSARAGVAKRTIYNVIGGKEALFRAVLAGAVDTAERYSSAVVADLGRSDDVAEELHDAALWLAQAVLGGRIVPLRRLLVAESQRFPELAEEYYRRAPGLVMHALAEALRRYDRRGLLEVDDPDRAGEQFAFLVLGASLDRALFGVDAAPADPEVVEARARDGVEVFLRAYRP